MLDKYYILLVVRTDETHDTWRVLAIKSRYDTIEKSAERVVQSYNEGLRSIDAKWELWSVIDFSERLGTKTDMPVQLTEFSFKVKANV